MQDIEPGKILAGRFTLKRRLGAGSAGEVWLSTDSESDQPVALKLFDAAQFGRDRLDALATEYRHLARLGHRHIVRPLGWYEHNGLRILAMEALDGGDFRRFIGRPAESWSRPLLDILGALEYLHDAGFVHRDIKASNLLLDGDGRAAIADFGIAAAFGGEVRGGGSMYAMSPQQLAGDPPQAADDLFAIGALLYELLTGAPPLHPDITADRLRNEMPAPPGNDAVADLVMSLLAKNPADRPATVREVRQRLETLWSGSVDNPTLPPANLRQHDDTPQHVEIRPSSMRVGQHDASWQPAATQSGAARDAPVSQWIMAWAALATLGLLAFAVFVFLPTSVEKRRAAAADAATPAAQANAQLAGGAADSVLPDATPGRVGLSPYQLSEMAARRERAERELKALLRTQDQLEARNVSVWAEQAFAQAREVGIDADVRFREREYDEAAEKYAEAGKQMEALLDSAERVLADAIAAAWAAFDAGDATRARGAFDYVAAIDPDNAEAVTGLKRTVNLDALVALTRQAAALERDGKLSVALDKYREAVALDPRYAPAVEGAGRVSERVADAGFNDILSRGYAALERQDYSAARTAFTSAAERRPGSQAAKAGLEQVTLADRLGTIQSLRAEAEAHVAAERWTQAVASFDALLEIDNTLVFARQGRENAASREALDARLRELIDQPDRLATDSVYDAAIALMKNAALIPAPGTVLADQQRRLARLIATARTPIKVTLLSDNATSVVVYKVDRLGTFERRELNLRPGKYTAVGSREGYRDVRREFTLVAGQAPDPVVVRCEEKI